MAAQAMLDQAEINLGYTEIRSPIDGRIGIANFTVGNLVDPSSGKLATIVSQDPIYVIFQPSERDVINYKRRVAESSDKYPARDRSHQAAQRQHLSACRPHQLPRRPGRSHYGHGRGARASAEPGGSSDPRWGRRRHGGPGSRRDRRWWFRNPLSSSIRPAVMSSWSTRPRRSSCDA